MRIIKDLQYKAQCFYDHQSISAIIRVILADGTFANILYRLAKGFQKYKLGVVSWFLLAINKFFNGCVIGRSAEFDEGFVLMHPVGVVINGAVKGGKNIVIESGVVIGAAKHGLPVKSPRLGDNIFVGAGAKILGGITIGNNVTIGANAVVIKDVPDEATVVGIPARPIHK